MPSPEVVREQGIVGAGGAGFPAHVKMQARAETVIVNAAECEPLLYKDKELLLHHGPEMLEGLRAVAAAVGASRSVVAIKEKYQDVIAALRPLLRQGEELHALEDFYPAGDEFLLVHDVTGRVIPPGGLPIHVGAVVNNVETLLNVGRGRPVTHKCLTVAGAVRKPLTLWAAIGTPISLLIEAAGGATVQPFGVLLGGVMMGRLAPGLDEPVTKTLGAVIVLPADHVLLQRYGRTQKVIDRIGHSACDQCSFCTELCPRYLLGHPIEPHRAMRTLGFTLDKDLHIAGTLYCCECNLCTLMSCPEDLDPKNACVNGKKRAREIGSKWSGDPADVKPHAMAAYRRTPVTRLMKRLDLTRFAAKAPLRAEPLEPAEVRILLKQHVGVPAEACVAVGDPVGAGQAIARVPQGALGVTVHASVAGRIAAVDAAAVVIRRQ